MQSQGVLEKLTVLINAPIPKFFGLFSNRGLSDFLGCAFEDECGTGATLVRFTFPCKKDSNQSHAQLTLRPAKHLANT